MAERLRPLGPLEKWHAVRSHLGIYNNVGVSAWYRIPPGSHDSYQEEILGAVSSVIDRHPSLWAVPVDLDTPHPRFERLAELRLDEVIKFITLPADGTTGQALDQFLQQQHSLPFSNTVPASPFWRLAIVRTANDPDSLCVSFIFHHALSDTQSGLVFHADLEDVLSSESSLDAPAALRIAPPPIDLLPPLEAVHSLPLSESYLEATRFAAEPPNTWNGHPQSLPLTTRFKSFFFSRDDSAALLNLARARETSLTAVFQVIIATTLFSLLPDDIAHVTIDCAISLRPFCESPIDSHSIGTFASPFLIPYQRHANSNFNWDEVERTKTTLDTALAKRGADLPVGALRNISDMTTFLRDKIGTNRAAAVELSNVGVFRGIRHDESGAGRWHVGSMLFSQSASACGGAIKVGTVTGRDGRLSLGVAWQVGIVDDDFVDGFMSGLANEVRRVCVQI